MTIKDSIISKINEQLEPQILEVEDDSNKHRGHAGWQEGGETHFNLLVVSEKFAGLSKINRHKVIYGILGDEMRQKIHALSIKAYAPEEYRG